MIINFNDFDTLVDGVNRNFLDLLNFDKDYYIFNRDVKDMCPYTEKHLEDRDVLVFNVVGMASEDITIKVEKEDMLNYLHIDGDKKDKITEKPYNIRARFSIDTDKVANIKYKVENGLLYITLYYKKPEKSNIKIECEDRVIVKNN